MSHARDLDAPGIIDALNAEGVRYIVIGGVAAVILGSPSLTGDIDICYARDPENLGALAAALQGIHARHRGASEKVAFRFDPRALGKVDSVAFDTDLGDLDVVAMPRGTYGFDDLARDATSVQIGGRPVLVASIDDLIRMKRAAGRPKDLIEIEILGALREEVAKYG